MHDENNTKMQAMSEEKLDGTIKYNFKSQRVNGRMRCNEILILTRGKFIYKEVLEWKGWWFLDECFLI